MYDRNASHIFNVTMFINLEVSQSFHLFFTGSGCFHRTGVGFHFFVLCSVSLLVFIGWIAC